MNDKPQKPPCSLLPCSKNHLPYFSAPAIERLEWVTHAFLTRQGGVSSPPCDTLNLGDHGDDREAVARNREGIGRAFSFDPARLVLFNQKHQDNILIADRPFGPVLPFLEYDAAITATPGLFLGIRTADCVPILVVDQKKKVAAAIHAGRQGTALHIASKVLRRMSDAFGSQLCDLLIAIGPCIGPCCYEIDERVFLPEWKPFSAPRGGHHWMLDLASINRAEMERQGIDKTQIFTVEICTACRQDLFFSYRRDGTTGRQLSFIGKIP
jgi:polyphenol oxidase